MFKMLQITCLLLIISVGETTAQTILTADNASSRAYFGRNVTVDGDIAIVGADAEDTQANNAGAAYVFRLTDGEWIQETMLTADDGVESDRFGRAMARSGDAIIIGAPLRQTSGNDSGAAYIYRYDGSHWNQEAVLTASNADVFAHFGNTVDISGNLAIVGAWGEKTLATSAGAAYIFEFDGSTWNETDILRPSTPAAHNDFFGDEVSISDNIAFVSSPGNDLAGEGAGAVFVYRNNGSGWIEDEILVSPNPSPGTAHEAAHAWDGHHLVVGSSGEDGTVGAAYVYRNDGTAMTLVQKLQSSDAVVGGAFGANVGVSGDFIVVGAPWLSSNASFPAEAYVFHFNGTQWEETLKLTAKAPRDAFETISVSDGNVIIGAQNEDTRAVDAGAAYIYNLNLTATDVIAEGIPEASNRIEPNYPNPFTGETTLKVVIGSPSQVSVDIHDSLGRKIGSLVNSYLQAGTHEFRFNSDNAKAGAYYQVMTINGKRTSRPLIIVK